MPQTERSNKSQGLSTVIPGHRILIKSSQSAPPGPHKLTLPHECAPAAPTVKVIKDGDTVRAIEVTCVCGEVVRLECAF